MATKVKKATKVVVQINGGVLVAQRIGCDRMEWEFGGTSDEVAGIKAHADGLAASGKFTTVFVRWWTIDPSKPVGQTAGVVGENFLPAKKVRKSRAKKVVA